LIPGCRTICPLIGSRSPLMIDISVDLPSPLRPIRQTRSPGSICTLTPSSTSPLPKFICTSRRLNNAIDSTSF
jgi:hypothetical protein